MSWEFTRAQERARKTYDDIGELEVLPIVRETQFDEIALRKPRLVDAAHCYIDITTFRSVVGEGAADEECVWALNAYAREVARIIGDFDGEKVHMQGPKAHAVVYRPVGDESARAIKAVLMTAGICEAARRIPALLGIDTTWTPAGGVDMGEALVTKDGAAGDRELLFLGTPANTAAKIITTGIVVTDRVIDVLPDDITAHMKSAGSHWRFSPSITALESLVDTYGYDWTAAQTEARLAAEVVSCPVSVVKIARATEAIDKSTLGLSNSKLVEGVSLFADVDGFTGFITDAELTDTIAEAVRSYHVIRTEMRAVLCTDYEQLRVQYQGDRMQGQVYQPLADDAAIAVTAVEIAAALMSTVDQVLPDVIGDASKPLAIGLAYGPVVTTKFGERGDRDVVTLGEATAEAARIQQSLPGGSTGINSALRELLPEGIQELFPWDASARAYVAIGIRMDELTRFTASEAGLPLGEFVLTGLAVAGAGLLARALGARRTTPPEPGQDLRPWHRG